jgi:acetyltransferase-like isoleucine patch superfamily enzyme
MAYLKEEQLAAMGFAFLGKEVLISDRCSIYNPEMMSIGDRSRIDDFCVVSGKVKMGKNVYVAVFCNLAGGEEGIEMEDFSTLAYGVQVFTQSDDYRGYSLTNPTVPDRYKRETKKAVRLKRHVIVGAGSIVFPGVTIGEGGSVGAMSLVNKSTEPWKIYQGIPARPIADRLKELLGFEKAYLEELRGEQV